jgi:hypothetical protein
MKYCNILSTFIYFSSKLEALPPNDIQALLPFSKSTSKKMSVPLAWSLSVPLPLFHELQEISMVITTRREE